MTKVNITSDFANEVSFRLLAVDRQSLDGEVVTNASAQKETTVVSVLKGNQSIIAHDTRHSWLLRRSEYSNALLLADRRRAKASECDTVVTASLSRVFETVMRKPTREVLRMLAACPVSLEELESTASSRVSGAAQSPKGFTFAELLRADVCSVTELQQILSESGALVVRKRIRLLEASDAHQVLTAALQFIENAGDVDTTWDDIVGHLSPRPFPRTAVRAIQAMYEPSPTSASTTVAGSESANTQSDTTPLFDPTKVAVSFAEHVFRSSAQARSNPCKVSLESTAAPLLFPALPLEVFLTDWLTALPQMIQEQLGFSETRALLSGNANSQTLMKCLGVLNGFAIVRDLPQTTSGKQPLAGTVVWAPQSDLVDKLANRLDILFALRDEKWTDTELRPYVVPLLLHGETFEGAIHRYAREYRIPGEPTRYSKLCA